MDKLVNPDATFLSASEIGKIFSPNISKVSIWRWQKDGRLNLTKYKFGSRVFYKKEEVIDAIKKMS